MDIVTAYVSFLTDNAKDLKTIHSYEYSVKDFMQWIAGEQAVKEARSIDVKNYLNYLRHERRMAPSTVNKYIASLNSFYQFLEEHQQVEVNPMKRIRRVAVADSDNEHPKWLSVIEQERFLDYADLEKNDWLRTRNLAAIDLMLYAGLRVQEVVDLYMDDLTLSGKDLKVVIRDGKRGKYGVVTLIAKYARNVKRWLRSRKECDKPFHLISSNLFVSERTGKLTTRNVQKFVSKYGELSGISGITPHRLRHSFCKNLARQDTPIEVIRRLARHEKIETTAIYIDPGAEELVKALRKL